MIEENEPSQSGDGESGKTSGRDERRRTALTNRATAAEQKLSDLQTKFDAQSDSIAEMEGKTGGIDRMVERLQAKNKKLEDERDVALAATSALSSKSRTSSLVSALSDEHDMPAKRVRSLLLGLKSDNPELDIAPEGINRALVSDFSSMLKEFDPDLFKPTETGKPRSRPGPAPAAHERGLQATERQTANDRSEFIRNNPIFQQPDDGRLV